jgi:aspartyl-tRNA synthetase
LKRTCYCGELEAKDIGREVVLEGWVNRRRDHGGVTFVDLRDREGLVQVVFNPEVSGPIHEKAKEIKSEYVIRIKGQVSHRPPGTENPKIRTGEIEVAATEVDILNPCLPLPLRPDSPEVTEEIRLKYRFLDLRRPEMQSILRLRHRAAGEVRNYLDQLGFIDVETPFLTKSTPEGARDYLVPSRVNPGKFYALPQSPQLFKQILMVAGFDRYYQIVKCFRDEDLRADRQPEFTQIDLEMSFVEREDVMEVIEGLVRVLLALVDVEVPQKFPVMSYQDALLKYGIDRPDSRFEMLIQDVSPLFEASSFAAFKEILTKRGVVRGFKAPGGARFYRKELDNWGNRARELGAKGLISIKVAEEALQSNLLKYLTPGEIEGLKDAFQVEPGDALFLIADEEAVAAETLGRLRIEVAQTLNLIPENTCAPLWVVDFPLLEWGEEDKRYIAVHHPFTSPMDEDLSLLDSDPLKVRAKAYDVVLNGQEIGGGSIRIHQKDVQKKIFQLLHISDEEARVKFGFLLEALQYGAPPHGGIALGLDRIMAILTKSASIREVIPFPKTQKAQCLMTEAPSLVSENQLKELKIRLTVSPEGD